MTLLYSSIIDDKQDGVYRLKAIRDSGQVFSKEVTFLYEYPFIDTPAMGNKMVYDRHCGSVGSFSNQYLKDKIIESTPFQ